MITRPSRIAVRKTGAVRECYSRQFLLSELLTAAQKCEDYEFAKFHVDTLNNSIEKFNINSMTASVQCFSKAGDLEDFGFHTVYNVSSVGKNIYSNIFKMDRVKEISFKQAGKAIFNTDIMTLEKWLDTEMYYHLKIPLGIHHSVTIMYDVPYKKNYKFKTIMFSDLDNEFDSSITSDEVEYLSLPLYLGWLYRIGVIDVRTFSHWLELLVDVTPMRLALLREIVNIGRYHNSTVATNLHVSDRVVRNYIAEAYKTITHLLPDPEIAQANTSPCVDLVRYYDFLTLVGSGSSNTNCELSAKW